MANTIETDLIPTQEPSLVDDVLNMVTEVEPTVIHVSQIETLSAYETALSLDDSKAIPNDSWNAFLNELKDDNDMIEIAVFEARLQVFASVKMRPPKSSGVGTSNRSDLENKVAKEVHAIFKVYKADLKAVGKRPLLYFRTIEVSEDATPSAKGTDEEE